MAITLTQLRSFLAVVQGGSITTAANELVVTQPSVSAAVTALSREVGERLLERDGRGIRPTAAGQEFAAYAAEVLGLLEQGGRAAREAAAGNAHALTIAAVTTAAESFVPPLLQAFALSQPQVELTLEVGNREGVLALVLGHEADVAIGGRPPSDARIDAAVIAANEMVLITAADDPLAGRRQVSPDELASRRFLLREPGSGTRLVNEEFLAGTGIDARTMTVGSNGAIKQAARAGLGVSFVSRVTAATEIDAALLGVIGLKAGLPRRHWYAMRSSVGPLRPVVSDFLAFVASEDARDVLDV